MKKSKWLIFIAVLIIGVVAVWWWQSSGSGTVKNAAEDAAPQMKIAAVNITDINDDRIKATSRIILKNPLPVEISSESLSYKVYIDSIMVVEDVYNEPFRIKSSDKTTIEVPMEILKEPMERVLRNFSKNNIDSAEYAVRTSFTVDVPVEGKTDFTLNFSKKLPSVQLPDVAVEEINLNILDPGREGIDVVIKMSNPNNYPLEFEDGKFSFTIDNGFTLEGILEEMIKIPAGATENISVHAKVTEGNIPKAGFKYITDKKNTHFTYIFSSKMTSDNQIFDGSKVQTTVTGTLDELEDAI